MEAEIELRRAVERVAAQPRACRSPRPPAPPTRRSSESPEGEQIPTLNVLDMTPEGRGGDPDFPGLHYR